MRSFTRGLAQVCLAATGFGLVIQNVLALELEINGQVITREARSGAISVFTQQTPNVISVDNYGPTVTEFGRLGVVGTLSAGSRRRMHSIFFIRLPVVADSSEIISASASMEVFAKDNNPSFNIDLWGLGYSTDGIIDPEWRLFGNTDPDGGIGIPTPVKVQDNWVTPTTPIPSTVTTNIAGDIALLDFIRSLYDAGAEGGDLAILRVNPDVFLVPESGGTPGYRNRWAPATSEQPLAVAGPDQTVDEGLLVELDGSTSTNATTYDWGQIAGEPVSLSSTTTAQPSFTAPYVSTNTTLTFQLVVNDNAGNLSDPDTVDITVVSVNNPPTADAGDDATIKEDAVATLDGSNSFDPEGDTPLGFAWTQLSGPVVTLLPVNAVVNPSFNAPLGVGNQLIFELVVDDGKEFSVADEVIITVVENSPPVADAGPDQTVDEGSLVNLNGTGSSDPDGGDTLSFDWTEPVALNDHTSSTPSFTAPAVGPGGEDLTFDLVVTDDDPVNPKSSAPDQVSIRVRNIIDPPNCDLARAVCPESKIKDNDGCTLWPPDHKLIAVSIAGVMDENSVHNELTLQITDVTQDEFVNDGGDGDTSPDAVIQAGDPVNSALIRAERTGLGGGQENGRVYVIDFTADDGFESCSGSVTVNVPHDRKDTSIDDGQFFDSTQP